MIACGLLACVGSFVASASSTACSRLSTGASRSFARGPGTPSLRWSLRIVSTLETDLLTTLLYRTEQAPTLYCIALRTCTALARSVERMFSKIPAEEWSTLEAKTKADPTYRGNPESERAVYRLLDKVKVSSAHSFGSDGSKLRARKEERALMYRYGLFNLFLTLNSYDKHHPLVINSLVLTSST